MIYFPSDIKGNIWRYHTLSPTSVRYFGITCFIQFAIIIEPSDIPVMPKGAQCIIAIIASWYLVRKLFEERRYLIKHEICDMVRWKAMFTYIYIPLKTVLENFAVGIFSVGKFAVGNFTAGIFRCKEISPEGNFR